MTHCYIFDYVNAKIYHTTIPDDVEDIDSYVAEKLNIKVGNIYTMCSDEELEIEELWFIFNMSQDVKCFVGLHKYEVLEKKDIKNPYGAIVGMTIISRCTNCGKIKETIVYTDNNYRRWFGLLVVYLLVQ